MTARRKIAGWLRGLALAIDDTPRSDVASVLNAMPKRRINRFGRVEYLDAQTGQWVFWQDYRKAHP